jgi:hypothetical protein
MDLGDLSAPFDFEIVGDGVRDHFNIEHRPINPENLLVYRNGALVIDPGFEGITFDYDAGMMVFRDPPPAGEVWEIEGTKWRYFSDADLRVFISTAVTQHSHNRGDDSGGDFTLGDLKPVEEYPVAVLAVIQALWALATDAAFDIDILSPDGVNIPRSERYRQLTEMIGARQQQYDEMAKALNIGLNRIESFTMRRTAKLTNRLVPVYLPQEYDDSSRPKRVLFPPNLLGTPPVKTGIGTYDVDVISGDPKEFVVQFPFDLDGAVIKNEIRRSPTSTRTGTVGPPLKSWTQTQVGPREMKLSLTGDETRRLPYNAYWELQATRAGETESKTELRGMVRATNNEVVR